MKTRRESKRKVIEGELRKRVAEINGKLDAHFEFRKIRVYVVRFLLSLINRFLWDRNCIQLAIC